MLSKKNTVRKKLAALSYLLTALASLILGSIYLFKDSFMPYHAAALSKNWPVVDSSVQVLISALMTVAGGGWVSIGLVIVLLVVFPFKNNQTWAVYALPVLILLFYIPNLWATLYVLKNTPANPPWYGNAIACLSAIIGYLLYPRPFTLDQRISGSQT